MTFRYRRNSAGLHVETYFVPMNTPTSPAFRVAAMLSLLALFSGGCDRPADEHRAEQPSLLEEISGHSLVRRASSLFMIPIPANMDIRSEDDRMRLQRDVLDFGAGNGMMGEALARHGVSRMVGVDISAVARDALERDRPGLYDDYCVADLSKPDPAVKEELQRWKFSCLTTVAALGYNDIPESALREAFNLVEDGGWIAFNVKETFLGKSDGDDFSSLVKRLLAGESLHLHHLERYQHRISVEGNPLYYYAAIGRKRAPWPQAD